MKLLDQVRQWLEQSSEPFGSFTRADGSPMLLDGLTAETLVSRLPDPTQASLDAATCQADRVRITAGGCTTRPLGNEVVLELDGENARALGGLLRIVEDPESSGQCMCPGSHAIEFLRGSEPLAVIGLHHAESIRWQDGWHWDAVLRDPEPLVRWLAEHGLGASLEERERAEASRRRSREAAERWLSFAPQCVRSPHDLIFDPAPDRSKGPLLKDALAAGISDPGEQVRAL